MKTRLITVISLVLPFILWGKLIPFSLAQDDYYLISQAAFNSVRQQVLSSLPNTNSIFFRPLGMQAYFYLAVRLFWITAWKYRIVAVLIHGINSILVYKISQKIIKSGAIFVWLMYLAAPWQFAAIGWIVNISYLSGAMFAFLSILSALEKRLYLPILFFTMGILTNELVAVVPLLMILLCIPRKRRLIIPIFMILGLYGLVRLKFPSASTGDYGFMIGSNVIQNIRWLLTWALGWPETYKDQFISFFNINKSFLSTFPGETFIFAVTSIVILEVVLITAQNIRRILFGISWFAVALSPVIFFTSHIYPHYAVIAVVGLYLIIADALSQSSRKLTAVFIILWIMQFVAGLKINLVTHWWPRHALEAGNLISKITNNHPFLPGDKRLFLETCNSVQTKLVLSGDNAVKLIYNDPDAKLNLNCNPQL
ncbi:hypothetical protein HZB78_05290 [Candidatus Collierbacteria bacterium]|nr:hypothetical protein [Candidatus Collierbacteria bacterium]